MMNTPKLRFKDNNGQEFPEWNFPELHEIAVKVKDKNKNYENNTVLTNSATLGIINQSEYFEREIVTEKNLSGYYIVNVDDFVYNPRISTPAPVGPVSRNLYRQGIMSPLYTVFRFSTGNLNYFEQIFKSKCWHIYIKSVANTGARHDRISITDKLFFSLPIIFPSLLEQQKIATFLSAIDTKITHTNKQIALLKQYKKGVMQQIFSQQLRFKDDNGQKFPEWERLPIGVKVDLLCGYPFDYSDISKDVSNTRLLRGINITEGWIRHSHKIDRYYHGSTDKLKKYRLQTNDLVIGMDGSKVGKNSALITPLDARALLVQRVARLRTNSLVSVQFIFQQINSIKFHAYVDRINTSSAIPHISAKQINNFHIGFPNLLEQQKIVSFLSAIDTKIQSAKSSLAALKSYKQGLLQQMFI
ncbi:MAG: type III restriction-modification system subunit S [Candidatus Desulfovibrio kirbyi]|uniref:Type III restriction-modification system subunit S n=1 Tax=Candidatus Desulfovibrio kirbyi TaxID=2696086 RepID=A0A6L2R4Q6_9BACT|nr:MAG: type III restriction-modification system subunit S [Candidatus Desulfovibrio kirbyi]